MTFLATTGASALAVGGAFSAGVLGGLPNSALFSFKLDHFPPVIGVGFALNQSSIRLAGTADWWLYHKSLGGPFYIYAGLGGYVDLQTGNTSGTSIGARLPIGLQFFPLNPLELFIEIAPRAGIGLNPFSFPDWGVQGAVGFRFWLK